MRCTADWVCRSDNHNRIILSYSNVARYRKKRRREGLHFSGSSPVGSALVSREQFWIRNKNRLDSPAALARTTCARSRHAEADLEIDKEDKLYHRICRPGGPSFRLSSFLRAMLRKQSQQIKERRYPLGMPFDLEAEQFLFRVVDRIVFHKPVLHS